MYNIPIKDGKEFFVISHALTNKNLTSKKEAMKGAIYIILVGVLVATLFPYAVISSGERLTKAVAMFLSSFVLIGGLFWVLAYWVYKLSDVDFATDRFLKEFSGRAGKRTYVMTAYWIDREYNDTMYDYLIINLLAPFLISQRVTVYIRGDIVTDIVQGFVPPEKWNSIDLDKISERIEFSIPAAMGDRKRALIFAKYLLKYQKEGFKEAFIRQPTHSLRYLDEIKAGNLPPKEGM